MTLFRASAINSGSQSLGIPLWGIENMKCPSEIRLNSTPPGQNGRHFLDDIFKCIFMIEKFCVSLEITLKFVPKVSQYLFG